MGDTRIGEGCGEVRGEGTVDLGEFGEGFCYAGAGLADVFIGGCIAQADIAGEAECGAIDGGNMCFFKEVHGEGGGIVYFPFSVAFSEEGGDFGEQIEGAFGAVDFQAGNFRAEFHHEVAAATECFTHFHDFILWSAVGCLGCFLSY